MTEELTTNCGKLPEKEFNLSEKVDFIFNKPDGSDKKPFYLEEDVKEFIQELKKLFVDFGYFCDKDCMCKDCKEIDDAINNLAGPKLI